MRLGPLVRNRLAGAFGWMVGTNLFQSQITRRLVTRTGLTGDDADRCFWFGDVERFEVRAPLAVDPLPEKIQRKVGAHRIEQPFVAEIRDIELIGPDAVAITDDGDYVLEESLGSIGLLVRSLTETTAAGLLPRRKRGGSDPDIEKAVSLVGPWCRGYYHWFSDYMLRLEGVEHYVEQTGTKPTLILPAEPPQWMFSSLELAGFGEYEHVSWQGGRRTVGSLVVPSLRRETDLTSPPEGYTFSPRAYRWLGDRIRSSVNASEPGAKIFVSRAGAEERHVVNEEGVMGSLSGRGFEAYRLEKMSFPNQVRLFAGADTIVGPTGAGLINMIYAEETDVVTLFGSLVNACYPVLADTLGFGNAIMRCRPNALDMSADPQKLQRLLDRF